MELDAKDLEVELPKAPPTPAGPGPGQPGYHGGAVPPEFLNPFPFRQIAHIPRPPYIEEGLPGVRHHLHAPLHAVHPPPVPFQGIQLHGRPEDEAQRRWREAQAQAQAVVAEQIRRQEERLAQREAQAAVRRVQAAQAKAAARVRAAAARERVNAAKNRR